MRRNTYVQIYCPGRVGWLLRHQTQQEDKSTRVESVSIYNNMMSAHSHTADGRCRSIVETVAAYFFVCPFLLLIPFADSFVCFVCPCPLLASFPCLVCSFYLLAALALFVCRNCIRRTLVLSVTNHESVLGTSSFVKIRQRQDWKTASRQRPNRK